jgi:hypothetical protein
VPASFDAARAFVRRDARVVEQRLFAALFEEAPPEGVARALEAYRNEDGGFGHGLEPDKRCPASQPADTALALELLARAGAPADRFLDGACAFLAGVADERGAVPLGLRSVLDYPHAEHWGGDWAYEPSVWATAWAVTWLHAHGAHGDWLERATAVCLDELEREPPGDAHAIRETFRFLEHVPDRERAERIWPSVAAALPAAKWFHADAASDDYGVSPLQLAPTPASPVRGLFADDQVEAHLDRLEADQQPDGGWPIRWEPPSAASHLEWRGIFTVSALATLRAYGRL